MFDLHSRLWEALGNAQAFLAIYGMINPDGLLQNPVYAQFLKIPAAVTLPLRPEQDPVTVFYRYPPLTVESCPTDGHRILPMQPPTRSLVHHPLTLTCLPRRGEPCKRGCRLHGANWTPPTMTSMRTAPVPLLVNRRADRD